MSRLPFCWVQLQHLGHVRIFDHDPAAHRYLLRRQPCDPRHQTPETVCINATAYAEMGQIERYRTRPFFARRRDQDRRSRPRCAKVAHLNIWRHDNPDAAQGEHVGDFEQHIMRHGMAHFADPMIRYTVDLAMPNCRAASAGPTPAAISASTSVLRVLWVGLRPR